MPVMCDSSSIVHYYYYSLCGRGGNDSYKRKEKAKGNIKGKKRKREKERKLKISFFTLFMNHAKCSLSSLCNFLLRMCNVCWRVLASIG